MERQETVLESGIDLRLRASFLGYYVAIATTCITIIALITAVLTPPLSGPFCPGNCLEYPYLDIVSRFPRDYYWMYFAMLIMLMFPVLVVCIHYFAALPKRIFSLTGLVFAIISSTILLIDYFIQVSVIQSSLLLGETAGISLITQYNPHGIFIVLEEVGYLMMSIALLAIAPIFATGKLERTIRWILILGFVFTILSLLVILLVYGIQREYYFEVAAITINWIVLIVAGLLLTLLFKRHRR